MAMQTLVVVVLCIAGWVCYAIWRGVISQSEDLRTQARKLDELATKTLEVLHDGRAKSRRGD